MKKILNIFSGISVILIFCLLFGIGKGTIWHGAEFENSSILACVALLLVNVAYHFIPPVRWSLDLLYSTAVSVFSGLSALWRSVSYAQSRYSQARLKVEVGKRYKISPIDKKTFSECVDLERGDLRITLDRIWRTGAINILVKSEEEAKWLKESVVNGLDAESFVDAELDHCSDLISEEIDAVEGAERMLRRAKSQDGSILAWLESEEVGFNIISVNYGIAGRCLVEPLVDPNKVISSSYSSHTSSEAVDGWLLLERFFVLRFGAVLEGSEGDFIDAVNPEGNIWVGLAKASSGREFVCVLTGSGYSSLADGEIEDIVEIGAPCLGSFIKGHAEGLLRSTYERDPDGLLDSDESLEDFIFEASETDDVGDFAPCHFGLGSETTNLALEIELSTGRVKDPDGELLEDMSALFGRIDEDETWVIGFSTS